MRRNKPEIGCAKSRSKLRLMPLMVQESAERNSQSTPVVLRNNLLHSQGTDPYVMVRYQHTIIWSAGKARPGKGASLRVGTGIGADASFTSTSGAVGGGLLECACRHPFHCDAWSQCWQWKPWVVGGLNCEGWRRLQTLLGQRILKLTGQLIGLLVLLTY